MAMHTNTSSLVAPRRGLPIALALSLMAMAPACGGGGGSSPAIPSAPAPANLVYSTNPAVYVKGTAIAANTPTVGGGTVASYAVSPALPAGLALNATTGSLTGTPSVVAVPATYTVSAANASGSATASLRLQVNDLAPAFDFTSTDLVLGKDDPFTPLAPSSTGGAVVAWSIAPALPPGLVISTATGTLSGTPTAAAAPQAYTVTATNSGGTLGKVLNLTVIGAPPLIANFSGPALVNMGDSAPLAWTISGDPASALTINGASLPLSQSGSATVTPVRRVQYTLTATNLKGSTQAVTTVAARGLDLFAGNVDGAGWVDGTGAAARFNQPQGIAADAVGNLYVSDTNNHTIRKITPGGDVTTFAGYVGELASWDGTPGGFRNPAGLASDTSGNLYVADLGNHRIRKITPDGTVTTMAGSGIAGLQAGGRRCQRTSAHRDVTPMLPPSPAPATRAVAPPHPPWPRVLRPPLAQWPQHPVRRRTCRAGRCARRSPTPGSGLPPTSHRPGRSALGARSPPAIPSDRFRHPAPRRRRGRGRAGR